MRYRKKPVVIEAVQWTGTNLEEIKSFVGERKGESAVLSAKSGTTLERYNESQTGWNELSKVIEAGEKRRLCRVF